MTFEEYWESLASDPNDSKELIFHCHFAAKNAFYAGRAAGLEESRDAVEGLSYDASRGDCADAIRNLSKEPS